MPEETMFEQRLSAVEHAIVDLQRRLGEVPASPDWLDKVIGSVTDEAAFREALEYGRAFREADRPSDGTDDEP